MNTEKHLLRRLLKSFPVKTVKEHFGIDAGNQDEVITEIVKNNAEVAIKDFSYSHFNYSKQHIYVYHLPYRHNFKEIHKDTFEHEIIKQSVSANNHLIFCLAEITFEVVAVVGDDLSKVKVKFYQPLHIEVKERYLIIRFTTLETKLQPYFSSTTKLYGGTKVVDEKAMIADILVHFQHCSPERADLNKGVKHLWSNKVLDAREVKFKKAKSTSKETMDEDHLVAEQYPEVYDILMQSPLNKTILKYKLENDDFCEHFVCDPTNGEISLPLYSINPNQAENIINEIIRNN